MTDRFASALISGYKMALLAQIDHPTEGLLYFWTGIGTLRYSGIDYVGTGVLGKVTPISYNSNLSIQEITFELSGLPPQPTRWIDPTIQDHIANVWLAMLDKRGRVIPDPKKVMKARIDYPKYLPQDDGTVKIQLIGRSGFYTLERALDEVHSSEDQKRQYATDVGCDMISALQQQTVIWKPI